MRASILLDAPIPPSPILAVDAGGAAGFVERGHQPRPDRHARSDHGAGDLRRALLARDAGGDADKDSSLSRSRCGVYSNPVLDLRAGRVFYASGQDPVVPED